MDISEYREREDLIEKYFGKELEDFVLCPYCKKRLRVITSVHLNTHEKTFEDFRREFPGYKVRCNSSNKKYENGGNELQILKVKKYLAERGFELISKYKNSDTYLTMRCIGCGNVIKRHRFRLYIPYKCPVCNPSLYVSSQENEIYDFLKNELNISEIEIIRSSKSIIHPFELDLFLPLYNLAIEFNGLYWHSEKEKPDIKYHLKKYKLCKEKGITLIQIFEDEWEFKKEIVKEIIKYLLNKYHLNKKKIYATECQIKEIDSETKDIFLEKFHIRGTVESYINLGAFGPDGNLLSVMIFSKTDTIRGKHIKEDGKLELSRFCFDYNYDTVGIFNKLFNHFKRKYDWSTVFAYCDLRWSDGKVYEELGFESNYRPRLNYYYFIKRGRVNRLELKNNIEKYKKNEDSNFIRIWDCGNLKFTLKK